MPSALGIYVLANVGALVWMHHPFEVIGIVLIYLSIVLLLDREFDRRA